MTHSKSRRWLACLLAAVMMISIVPATASAEEANATTPSRQMEYLTRGLVTMETESGIYMSWRFLGTDPDDVAFNIYRNGVKIATIDGESATNYLDEEGAADDVYTVSSIINGVESAAEGSELGMLTSEGNGSYAEFALQQPEARPIIQFRSHRDDLYAATGKYFYMPIDEGRINAMQTIVTDYKAGKITKAYYDEKVAEFKAYTDSLGLDATGGEGPTLRELGYSEDGKTPLKVVDGVLQYSMSRAYSIGDMSTGDLDGDGDYELIVKWNGVTTDSMISYSCTSPCILDAYDLNADGTATLLWRVDLGYNIRAGEHDTQYMVYDFDGDGKSELILRTADGSTSGQVVNGEYIPQSFVGPKEAAYIDDYILNNQADLVDKYITNIQNSYTICWEDPVYDRGDGGYITTGGYRGDFHNQFWCKVYVHGPTQGTGDEYITAFDGVTGKIIDTIDYKFEINEVEWGIDPNCRRGASATTLIENYDAYRAELDPNYIPQSFWAPRAWKEAQNDIGNTYMSYGDCTGNRSGRFNGGVGLLDGETPAAVLVRGYYRRSTVAAYTLKDNKLALQAYFDSSEYDNHLDYENTGNHNIAIGDIDGDGCDEFLHNAMCLELASPDADKLTVKYIVGVVQPTGEQPATNSIIDVKAGYNEDGTIKEGYAFYRLPHGDAIHLLPINADNQLALFSPHEEYGDEDAWGAAMHLHDAATGEVLFASFKPTDQGRGTAANVDPFNPDTVIMSGNIKVNYKTGELSNVDVSNNFFIYWSGSLVRQNLSNATKITQNNAEGRSETLMQFTGCSTANGTKSSPCLSADLLGDWREEIVLPVSGKNSIRVWTTNMPTEYKIRTLMHDPQYRIAVSREMSCYNQPPHTGFFMGYEALRENDTVISVLGINGAAAGSIIPTSKPIISTSKRDDIYVNIPFEASIDESAAPNKSFTATVTLPASYGKVYLANEAGSGLVSSRSFVRNDDGTATWTIVVEGGISTIGQRTLSVIADGQNMGTLSILIDNVSKFEANSIRGVSAPPSAKANENFTTIITTSQSVEKVRLFSENGTGLAPTSCTYEDKEDGTRVWTYVTSLGSRGVRTLTPKFQTMNGYVSDTNLSFTISIR